MHTFILYLLFACNVLAARVFKRDQTITQNTRDATLAGSLGLPFQNTTVDPGVTYFVTGQGPHPIFGNIDNFGNIIYSQVDALSVAGIVGPLVVDYVSAAGSTGTGTSDGNLINEAGALISINDFGATTGSTYDFQLSSLQNAGTLQFCGRGDNTGSLYTLTTANNLNNNGVIDLEQYYGNVVTGTSVLGNAGASGTSLSFNFNNNGLVRIVNLTLPLAQNVLGTGCFRIDTGSTLYLTAGAFTVGTTSFGSALSTQAIYFSSTTSGALRFDAAGVLPTATQTLAPLVYGFGPGRALEFLSPIASVSYTSPTLKVNFGATAFVVTGSLSINIGPGYTASGFSVGISNLNPAVLYSGTAGSRTLPSACGLAVPTCGNPATQEAAVSFPVTLSVSNGVTVTAGATVSSTSASVSASVSTSASASVSTSAPTSSAAATTSASTSDAATSASAGTTSSAAATSSVASAVYPSTVTGTPGTAPIFSTLTNGQPCTCPAPSITVYVTA